MSENHWKTPKDIEGELQWKHGLSWRDVYFQVSTNTIYLYPRKRKRDNQILHSISLTQIDEISEIGTKLSKRCFKIVLKMGAIEQFKCPAKMDNVKVQQLINNLRHAQKFWTDKENLQQRKPGRQRKVTLEASESVDMMKHRVFFTLWNGEMIGLLVDATSTLTSVYLRLFSFACKPSSCSLCKIRHQSCDLWSVDTTGTARRVRKDEFLIDLGKAGHSLFVMEHHQKLLVVYFSDVSYETMPVPAGITAKQILKLDQIASKLNELSCFDPGLFLRYENGKEVQFCMNDNPFKYQEYGKIVARSKRIRLNSLKKSDHEIIAEMRWKEFEEHHRRKKASDIANELLAGQIRKSSRMDEELCFVDDHFALNNDESRSHEMSYTTVADPRGIQARRDVVQGEEGYGLPKSREYITEVGGNNVCNNGGDNSCNDGGGGAADGGDDLKTCADTDTLSVSTCSEPNVAHQLPPGYDVVSVTSDEHAATKSPDDGCPKNSTDVITIADEVTTKNLQDRNDNDGDAMRRDSLDSNYSKNNNDVTNTSDCIGIQNNQDVSNQSLSDGACTKNNNDVSLSCDHKDDVTETIEHDDMVSPRDDGVLDTNLVTSDNSCTINNDDVTNTSDGAEKKDDIMGEKSSNDQLVKSNNDDTNILFLDQENSSSPTQPNADQTGVSRPSDCIPVNPDGSPNSSPNLGSILSPNTIPDTNPDPKTNLNPTKPSNPSQKNLMHSQSDGLVFRKQRQDEENSSHTSSHRSRLRSLSDLNVRYSFTSNETRDSSTKSRDAQVTTRDARAMSEPDMLEKDDDVLLVIDVFPRKYSSDYSEDDVICRPSEIASFTGPTWTFAKRVEECVRKILNVKDDIPQVEKLISEDLCKVLYELLDDGLKKNFLRISLFSIGSNVWDICQTVCKATKVGINVIQRIKDGSIDKKFHIFIRECIRHKILSRWFEELSSENVQKQIMKHYEPTAVVLEPEHSKAIEHLMLYLDGLDVLKLERLKARESGRNSDFLFSFE